MPVARTPHSGEVMLRAQTARVGAELAAWENSNVAKLTKPLRALSGKLRRSLAARRGVR